MSDEKMSFRKRKPYTITKLKDALELYVQMVNSKHPNWTFDIIGVKKEHLKELIENYTTREEEVNG